MIRHLVTLLQRHFALSIFDRVIDKFIQTTAFHTQQMVMVLAFFQFKQRVATFEMMPRHQAGRLKLCQNAINRSKPYVLAGGQKSFIDILCAHVATGVLLENMQYLEARHRRFEPRFFQIMILQRPLSFSNRKDHLVRSYTTSTMPDSRRHAVKVQRKMMKKLFMFLLLVTNALMVGCSIHRIDIQQGNVLDDAAVAKVQIGMTKTQVQFLLGTPLIADPFHKDRWDYFFSKRQGEKVLEQRHIALFFENDQLNKIDHDDAQRVLPKKDQ